MFPFKSPIFRAIIPVIIAVFHSVSYAGSIGYLIDGFEYDPCYWHCTAMGWTIAITEHTSWFNVEVVDRKHLTFLSESFHGSPYTSKPPAEILQEDYRVCAELVSAIRRTPDFMEEQFAEVMDCITGKIWERDEEEKEEE